MKICKHCGQTVPPEEIQPEERYPHRMCVICGVGDSRVGDYVLSNGLCPYHNYFNQDLAKQLGSRGGKARKEKTTLEQRREWGKKGGRPRKSN